MKHLTQNLPPTTMTLKHNSIQNSTQQSKDFKTAKSSKQSEKLPINIATGQFAQVQILDERVSSKQNTSQSSRDQQTIARSLERLRAIEEDMEVNYLKHLNEYGINNQTLQPKKEKKNSNSQQKNIKFLNPQNIPVATSNSVLAFNKMNHEDFN